MPPELAATIRYRLSLPHALHSVSPALSALHTSRVAALHPETSHPSHCPKCGTYRYSGDHPSSLVGPSARKKRRRQSKALYRRCHLCGFSIDARTSHSPLLNDLSRTETMPTIPRTQEIGQDPSPNDVSRPTGTVQTTECVPVPGHPKPGHTKASALRDMLSRDRQREEVVQSQKEGREGLAAFLKEL